MQFNTLANKIFRELARCISEHEGLEVFAVERAKFEGWVKVELVRILRRYFERVVPEEEGIDVVAGEWAIEIKTINTNYTCPLVKKKHRPITKNVKEVLEDIKKLKNKTRYKNKVVFFIAFPLPENAMDIWKDKHLSKIQIRLKRLLSYRFRFKNNEPGIMYLGPVSYTHLTLPTTERV